MTKYTPEQIAAIYAESRRLLEDEPNEPPATAAPMREVPIPEPEDAMDRWRREAAEADARRAAAKAELRRAEDDLARSRSAVARIVELERRCAELEQNVANANAVMNELAQGAEAFARAVDEGLLRMEKKLGELGGKLVELRAADDQRRVVDLPKLVRRTN
jgi:chromosome segregation ATPase